MNVHMSYGNTFILKSNPENGNLKCKLCPNSIDKKKMGRVGAGKGGRKERKQTPTLQLW